MAENNFENTVGSLFNGMTNFMTTKTVVGEAIHIGDTIILPLVDVSFGMGASAKGNSSGSEAKNGTAGGMGGKMSPSAVLVINNGTSKIISIKNQDIVTKLADMIPDIINKFTKSKSDEESKELSNEEIIEIVSEPAKETE